MYADLLCAQFLWGCCKVEVMGKQLKSCVFLDMSAELFGFLTHYVNSSLGEDCLLAIILNLFCFVFLIYLFLVSQKICLPLLQQCTRSGISLRGSPDVGKDFPEEVCSEPAFAVSEQSEPEVAHERNFPSKDRHSETSQTQVRKLLYQFCCILPSH